MADKTKIEWADATVNAINGCSLASPGCTNCYAMKQAHRFDARRGLTRKTNGGMVWTGEVRLNEKALLQPLSWAKPRRIFWNAHGDTFHDAVPDEWIDRVMAVCALTPQHTHMILTKRSKRMREFFRESTGWRARIAGLLNDLKPSPLWNGNVYQGWQNLHGRPDGLPNVWLGVSVEDQTRADERIPDLLATPAAVRFLSCEPLLGRVDLTSIAHPDILGATIDAVRGQEWSPPDARFSISVPITPAGWSPSEGKRRLHWVIAGGESGPGARPMHPDWARSLRDQCAAAGVPFHFKQWGNWAPVSEMSEDLLDDIYHPAPERRPDASRRCKVAQCVLHKNGKRFDGNAIFEPGAFWQGTGAMTMFDVGKKRAGRLLDGVEHNGFPQQSLN